MASSQNTRKDADHGINDFSQSATDASSSTSPQCENSEASSDHDDDHLINLRLVAFMNEPIEHGNRNVTLPDQTTDPSITMQKAEASMAKKLQGILGCCNLQ
ncbi:hypothetical protein G7054_g13828 [Neopestalotiopsis clavispora]|nr:hypothetical protein G7054_g13828 [Neopestalotiopsis clavispora]